MNSTWQSEVEEKLGVRFERMFRLGGGDFATAYRAFVSDGSTFFIKTHERPPPAFFTTEASGLQWLHRSGTVNIPRVLGASDHPPYLALSWIHEGQAKAATEVSLGRQLGQLHACKQQQFGRSDGATTGSLALPNRLCDCWAEFYATQRLLPLIAIARQRSALPVKDLTLLEKIAAGLSDFDVPDEPPALLHGDLWSGNRLVDRHGESWLIDPAVHCGHREFELGMMALFGGFGAECFAAYHEVYPLAPGWQERQALHQLAPLVVHAIKFGGSYLGALRSAMSGYVS